MSRSILLVAALAAFVGTSTIAAFQMPKPVGADVKVRVFIFFMRKKQDWSLRTPLLTAARTPRLLC
jgi:hypothetical protein